MNIRNTFLPFHQPLIEDEEINAVIATLKIRLAKYWSESTRI